MSNYIKQSYFKVRKGLYLAAVWTLFCISDAIVVVVTLPEDVLGVEAAEATVTATTFKLSSIVWIQFRSTPLFSA